MTPELIINIALVAIMVATYFVNEWANKKIKEKVERLENQRDLATMVALQIIKNKAIQDEDYEGAQKITKLMEGFTMDDFDVSIMSNKPFKTKSKKS